MKQLLIISFTVLLSVSNAFSQVPTPSGLSGKLVNSDSMNHVLLTWNGKTDNDSLTVGYNILSNFPPHSELMISQKVGVVYDTSYLFPISNTSGATYRFAVIGLNNFPKIQRSQVSKVIEVFVPSTHIPHVHLNKLKNEKDKLILTWEYPNSIADLEGFKIILNNKVITQTPAVKRSMAFPLKEEGTYIFQVQAYTKRIEGKPSQKRLIKVEN